MVRVECVANQGFGMFISMPLLTELVLIKEGFSYRHGAPNGAGTTRQHCIPPSTARNPALGIAGLGRLHRACGEV